MTISGSRWWRRAGALAFAAVALLGAGRFGIVAADTASPPTTTKASTPTQTDVAPPGPLTGLNNGDVVTITASGPTGGFFGFDARLCRPGVEINSVSKFNPTQQGNCIDAPINDQSDDFVHADQDLSNTSATLQYRVATGTNTVEFGGQFTRDITCGPGSPCTLWLKQTVNLSEAVPTGLVFVHYDLEFAGNGSPATTTTTSTDSTSTTVAPTTTAPPGSTPITTAPSSTSSTSTTGATTTSTTSTTAPPLTATPSSLGVGEELSVTSTGWKPEAKVTAVLSSDPVTLGTMTADGSGSVAARFAIPAGVTPGSHSLVLTGLGPGDASRELRTAITVTDGSTTATTRGGGGALARAGADVARLLFSGAGFMVAGYLFIVTVKRRDRMSTS